MNERTPILIVGGGPVGLTLAGDLGWRGQPCVLVDNSDGVVVQPKMVLVGVRTLEFCRRWGIAQQVEQSGYPADYSQDYVYVTSLDGMNWRANGFRRAPASRARRKARKSVSDVRSTFSNRC